MRIIDRLTKYLNQKLITAYSFERKCQVANGYLKKQVTGKGSIGSDILARIYEQYPDLNLIWLITGKGEMILPEGDERRADNQVEEEKYSYSKDEKIQLLNDRITLLESSLSDKKRIIDLLEKSKKKKDAE